MKILVGSLIVAAAGIAALGQDPQTTTPVAPVPPSAPVVAVGQSVDAKVIAELATAANQLGGVKNAPFSADEVNESVQTLADGNRISHSSTNKVYRNSEGRMRRDMQGGAMGGVMGSTYTVSGGSTIVNPALGQQVLLDAQTQVARIAELRALPQAVTVVEAPSLARRAATEEEMARAKAELDKARQGLTIAGQNLERVNQSLVTATAPLAALGGQMRLLEAGATPLYVGGTSKYETRTEDLGTRDFGGVTAEGRRTITTIPAGAVGNDRPIEMVYERWFSKDLGMVVYSKRSDPRTGEQTYELKNIVRSEPDPSLFNIPNTYKKVSTNGTVYRTAAPVATTGGARRRPQQN